MPFRGHHASINFPKRIFAIHFISIDDPSVATKEVSFVFIVSVSIFVSSYQRTSLQIIDPQQLPHGTADAAVAAEVLHCPLQHLHVLRHLGAVPPGAAPPPAGTAPPRPPSAGARTARSRRCFAVPHLLGGCRRSLMGRGRLDAASGAGRARVWLGAGPLSFSLPRCRVRYSWSCLSPASSCSAIDLLLCDPLQ